MNLPPYRIVMWSALWCAPCHALKKNKTLEKVREQLGLTEESCPIEVRDVDSKEWEAASNRAKVSALPTLDFFKGAVRVSRVEGAEPPRKYVAKWSEFTKIET